MGHDRTDAALIARAEEMLSKGVLHLNLRQLKKTVKAGLSQTWPRLQAFLELARQHDDEAVAAKANVSWLDQFGFSLAQKDIFAHWDQVFEQVCRTKTLGDYLILSRISAKRMARGRYNRVVRQALSDWGHGLAHPADLNNAELLQVRRLANQIDLAGDEEAILDELDRRGADYGSARRFLAHAKNMHREVSSDLVELYWRRYDVQGDLKNLLDGETARVGVLNIYPRLFLNPDKPQRDAYVVPFLKRLSAMSKARGLPAVFRRASCNSTAAPIFEEGAKCVSFHSIADEKRPWALHLKESHLRGFVAVDRSGYSAWGEVAAMPLEDLDAADPDFAQRLQQTYVERENSFFVGGAQGFTPPRGQYIAVFLQVSQDTTQVAGKIPQNQLIDIVVGWAAAQQFDVVFKRHPVCSNHEVGLSLQQASQSDFVHVSDANIHDIARGAEAIVTTNSGSGFESLLQGKTVVTTGRCDYQQATLKARSPDKLVQTLSEVKNGRRVDPDEVAAFVEAYLKRMCIDIAVGDIDAQIDAKILQPLLSDKKTGPSV